MIRSAVSSFVALGTTATVAVTKPATVLEAEALLRQSLDEIDRACSRFRRNSEINRLRAAAGAELAVSELLLDALDAALRAARLTNGLVTPTLGRSLHLAGYDRDFDAIQPSNRAPSFLAAPDLHTVGVDRHRGTAFLPAGVELDLGSTAKALAADRAATAIAERLDCGVLVSLGGDIRLAGAMAPPGWPVVVDDSCQRRTPGAASIFLTVGGLATSSTATRRWSRGRRDLHHILDPRTGAPARGPWRTASVAAATCLDANIASTAAILLGEAAPAWLAERELPARLVAQDGTISALAGWPAEEVVAA